MMGADPPSFTEPFGSGAPLRGIGKIVFIGLNYRNHAREINAAESAEPIVFMKASDTVTGPYDEAPVPRSSARTDWKTVDWRIAAVSS